MKTLIFSFIFLVKVSCAGAQTTMDKAIHLKDSSIVRTLQLEIKQGTQEIKFSVNGYLSVGELSFKIEDPEGKQEGGFQLIALGDNGKRSPGSGVMTHNVVHPLTGSWKIKIQTNHANGTLRYRIEID